MGALTATSQSLSELLRCLVELASDAVLFISALVAPRAQDATGTVAHLVALPPNHRDISWPMDYFTLTTLSFPTVYVFLVFEHGRRRVSHLAVTCSPSMAWVTQQLPDAPPLGLQPRDLLRDNDSIYGHGVALFLLRGGIREVRTALRSPGQNPHVERFTGTLRRELLNHVIDLSGRTTLVARPALGELHHRYEKRAA